MNKIKKLIKIKSKEIIKYQKLKMKKKKIKIKKAKIL